MVTAANIKDLRERTGAGMVDCKNALTEAEGDIDRAIEILREKGLSAISKKAGRVASEGLSHAVVENGLGIVLEVNSETDFVAKNAEFVKFVNDVASQIATSSSANSEELLKEKWNLDNSLTVEDALSQKIATIGEKLSIRRFEKFAVAPNAELVTYVHMGGRVAVLVELTGEGDLASVGKDVAMQIAAMNPQFVSSEDVSAEYIEKEKKILTEQALAEGKPANIVEKMIEGRLSKGLREICLNDQEFVKDSDYTVKSYLEKNLGKNAKVLRFVRFETGEGIEKKAENFAEEVAKTMNG